MRGARSTVPARARRSTHPAIRPETCRNQARKPGPPVCGSPFDSRGSVSQRFFGQGRAGADAFEQIRLGRLQRDQAPQDVQHIQQFGRIFGRPRIGLNIAERRGRATVADLRTISVAAPVAEPLRRRAYPTPRRPRPLAGRCQCGRFRSTDGDLRRRKKSCPTYARGRRGSPRRPESAARLARDAAGALAGRWRDRRSARRRCAAKSPRGRFGRPRRTEQDRQLAGFVTLAAGDRARSGRYKRDWQRPQRDRQ